MKKKLSVLGVLLMAVVVTAYSVSGTYAKYTSSTDAKSSTARVAKWDIDFNTKDTTSHSFTFNLFDTILDTSDGNAETDVTSSNTDKVIAPGTKGTFSMNFKNNSEVSATYQIDYTVTNSKNIPIEFSVDNGKNWTTTLSDVAATALSTTADTTVTVQWRWAFEGTSSSNYTSSQTDTTDTTLGTAGTATIEVKAQVTATQVD